MLVFLIVFSLVLLFPNQTQYQTEAPDIEVQKFFLTHYQPRSFDDTPENLNANYKSRARIAREELENRNSIENRSRDMRVTERRAVTDANYKRSEDTYGYSVEIKNRGTRIIKTIFWDYQIVESSEAENPSRRQFRCVVNIKTNGKKLLEGVSSIPPVIGAPSTEKTLTHKVVINRIEYADGTIWQRPDWQPPDQFGSREVQRGQCKLL